MAKLRGRWEGCERGLSERDYVRIPWEGVVGTEAALQIYRACIGQRKGVYLSIALL